jgi:group I intron endonuclease
MQGCIYLITNLVNGKKYVGQHNKPTPLKRFKRHIWESKKEGKFALHQAINKYGQDNFICETLCICAVESLSNLEAYYAEQYETYCWDNNPGYNMTLCGCRGSKGRKPGYKHSEKTIAKISKSLEGKKGITPSEEHRKKISDALKGRVKTPEHLSKISKALTGKSKSIPKLPGRFTQSLPPGVA